MAAATKKRGRGQRDGAAADVVNILDRSCKDRMAPVGLSAFSFLFSELVQYCKKRAPSVGVLEAKLAACGKQVGVKVLELMCLRDKNFKRGKGIAFVISFIHQSFWKALWGKASDGHIKQSEQEYYIVDNEPIVNKFISVPDELSNLSCAAFVAGAIQAVLEGFSHTATVVAHSQPLDEFPTRVVYQLQFAEAS
eukprot:Amastigsp_a340400_118.p1 type:complete len:194 gc:universal Amastigsp_a340400_118:616-35(-)